MISEAFVLEGAISQIAIGNVEDYALRGNTGFWPPHFPELQELRVLRKGSNWVLISTNTMSCKVKDITDYYSVSGDPLRKITNLRDDQLYESWFFTTSPSPYWIGTNFEVKPGYAYELVTVRQTKWNTTECYIQTKTGLMSGRGVDSPHIAIHDGTLIAPERSPVWFLDKRTNQPEKGRKIDNADVTNCALAAIGTVRHAESYESKKPHVVYAWVLANDWDGLVFTAYRPDHPSDALTENVIGCGVAKRDRFYSIWFEAGNFKVPWHTGDELVLIVEALKDGKAYFNAVSIILDENAYVQESGEIILVPIPGPIVMDGIARWSKINNENVVGYSVYRDGKAINKDVINTNEYAVSSDVLLRPVIKGGYETLYCSSNTKASSVMMPLTYTFKVHPNPFAGFVRITYGLPRTGRVGINIYDVNGQLVNTLVSGQFEPGHYEAVWFGIDRIGRDVACGVYFVRFITNECDKIEKVILLR
ncbi:hypothetical protein AMJ83_11225 [candidate division WOR_3 bacterium SM23_42]|uniref:FlgD Ig-like domain-containing protein n=1 Tax=candidate division WOR_3 bacterium SM23_42 TaxID=1703779 RepID=A0A0S8FRZ4_UNCW3|nr:MAG: hypothetical protein AMJ83_11225 [candidate division WOR_3 bacterium SM23_42]